MEAHSLGTTSIPNSIPESRLKIGHECFRFETFYHCFLGKMRVSSGRLGPAIKAKGHVSKLVSLYARKAKDFLGYPSTSADLSLAVLCSAAMSKCKD